MSAPANPAWPPANRQCYTDFCQWLYDGGYSTVTRDLYARAVWLALDFLDRPHTQITATDLAQVQQHFAVTITNPSTCTTYTKGLTKFRAFLHRQRGHRWHQQPINWGHYIGALAPALAEAVRDYVTYCQRAWLPERQHQATMEVLCHLTLPLRWMAEHATLNTALDITPALWLDYSSTRIAAGIKPATLNRELWDLHGLLHFLADAGQPVCERMVDVTALDTGDALPRDVPVDQLQRLLAEIETEAHHSHANHRRMGVLDRAWVLLMLHCGLRVGEVRRLPCADLDLAGRKVRVTQSKGLKDRVVYLSRAAQSALSTYLDSRGPADTDHVFLYRHQPLSARYCGQRLHTYGQRCQVYVTPHMLRHSCATLLLNAGAPILTVQAILGHKHIDTTLGYARLYDGTVAADYYRAMSAIEQHLELVDTAACPTAETTVFTGAQMIALVDTLGNGTLNAAQRATVQALRDGILTLTTQLTAED